MIRIYSTDNLEKKLEEIPQPKMGAWIHLESPTNEEISTILELTSIPESFLRSPLDEEEVAHIDYEGDIKMVVIDIPKMVDATETATISTIPLALIQCENYLVSVCTASTTIVNDFFDGRIKNIDTSKKARLVYQIMYNNSTRFLYYLRRIDRNSDYIQKSLAKSMQNEEIFQLLELQKSLVFFSASLTANYAVVNKLNNGTPKTNLEELAILEDVVIENKQALEMCSIYREIIKSTMDAFASIVNNNQNVVMKILTIITVILTIPTLIAGFWGMNTGVPFEGKPWGFWVAIGIASLISVGLCAFMVRKQFFK